VGRAGGSEPFGSWSLHDLLEELASEAPAPGGGPLAEMPLALAATAAEVAALAADVADRCVPDRAVDAQAAALLAAAAARAAARLVEVNLGTLPHDEKLQAALGHAKAAAQAAAPPT
jgi:formiminotetrahydrofolate cyclodeaminase